MMIFGLSSRSLVSKGLAQMLGDVFWEQLRSLRRLKGVSRGVEEGLRDGESSL